MKQGADCCCEGSMDWPSRGVSHRESGEVTIGLITAGGGFGIRAVWGRWGDNSRRAEMGVIREAAPSEGEGERGLIGADGGENRASVIKRLASRNVRYGAAGRLARAGERVGAMREAEALSGRTTLDTGQCAGLVHAVGRRTAPTRPARTWATHLHPRKRLNLPRRLCLETPLGAGSRPGG